MVVQTNLTAMNSNRMLSITTAAQAKSTEKLSSGYKINRAADDAAGLAISEKMRRQIRGLTQATANAQDGISALQTAEGALNEVHAMLQRMNELAVKAGNETLQSVDKSYIQKEINALVTEVDRVANTTTFNEMNLLNGAFSGTGRRIQVGAEVGSTNQINIQISRMSWADISNSQTINVTASDYATINSSISIIKTALQNVSTQRSDLGAVQNRLEHTVANLKNVVENTTAAESAIRDTDMASEMVKFSNNNILAQAGQAMLAQANQANQGVLALLA